MGDASKAPASVWVPHVSFDGLVKLMYESDLARSARAEGAASQRRAWWGAPLVGVIMGSDSDLGVMQAVDVLDEFGVPSEVRGVGAPHTSGDVRLRAVGGEPRPA